MSLLSSGGFVLFWLRGRQQFGSVMSGVKRLDTFLFARSDAGALLRRVADSAAAEGVHEVELNTWYFNEHAQSAFAKLGFSVKNVRFSRQAWS